MQKLADTKHAVPRQQATANDRAEASSLLELTTCISDVLSLHRTDYPRTPAQIPEANTQSMHI